MEFRNTLSAALWAPRDGPKGALGAQSGQEASPEPNQDANGASKHPFGSLLSTSRRPQVPPGSAPKAPQVDPKETRIIDFPIVFHRFGKKTLLEGSGGPTKRRGNAAKVQQRASDRPKIADHADMPFFEQPGLAKS